MRSPITFVYGNCVFGSALDDGWAAFKVETSAYEWLTADGKRSRFLAILGALEALEADVQILRVARRWDCERYAREVAAECRDGAPAERAYGGGDAEQIRYIQEHAWRLTDVGQAQPSVFLIVSRAGRMRQSLMDSALRIVDSHCRGCCSTARETYEATSRSGSRNETIKKTDG